jgi:hypothetical protein
MTNDRDDIPEEVAALHPLIIWLGGQLERTDHPVEKLTVEETTLQELTSALLSLAGKEELRLAARDLIAIAFALEHDQSSPTLAHALVEVLNQEQVVAALEQLPPPAPPTEETVAAIASRFAQFSGNDPKVAPAVGEAAPDGSVKVDHINPLRRV